MSHKVILCSETAETKKCISNQHIQGVMSDVTEQDVSMYIAPKPAVYGPGGFRSIAPCGLHRCHDSRLLLIVKLGVCSRINPLSCYMLVFRSTET